MAGVRSLAVRMAMAPTRGPSSFLPNCRKERAARERAFAAGLAQHEIHEVGAPQLGRQAELARGTPRQRSASNRIMAAPGTCAAASMAAERLRVIGSSGSVLVKRSGCFLPVACAGAIAASAMTHVVSVAINRFMFCWPRHDRGRGIPRFFLSARRPWDHGTRDK